MKTEYSNIAAYTPEQFPDALKRIISNQEFYRLVEHICHDQLNDRYNADQVINSLKYVQNQSQFDDVLIIKGLKALAAKACNGLSLGGKENLGLPAIFMSNHRDIILDAAFLSVLLKDITGKRIYFGAGTNLYVQSWVEDMLRINNGFAVIRGGSVHEMMRNSMQLSSYIRYLLTEENAGVWIAQREGRAKNSDDRTQPALLKMLAMSGDKNLADNLRQLNIIPVSISYEYDPCDFLKAQEMQLKRDNPDWQKTPHDDFLNMFTGMLGKKGQTIFNITTPINQNLDNILQSAPNRNEQINAIATAIDKQIHLGYNIYKVNKIAYDLYLESDKFSTEYTGQDKSGFETYIEGQIAKIQIPDKDIAFLRNKILEMYANPLINQLNAMQH